MKRSELVRRTPLRAKAGLKSRTALAKGAPKKRTQRPTGPKQAVVALVFARDGGCCIRCGKPVRPEDRGVGFSVHHRAARLMGGTSRPDVNFPSNLVILCGSGTTGCHGEVESSRVLARAAGLLLWVKADPAKVPVQTWWGPALLDDKGRWSAVVKCPECRCDPVLCETDASGEHCADQSCGTCLHGCPLDDCLVCEVPS
jgi:hypothetical protein